jgi:tRNA C32,U32 (ribose-2'-O)-methylase TrmJ
VVAAGLDVRTAAARAREVEGDVAFVFGNEQAGLTNDELFACQNLVHIPASKGFSSLNLAQAVQVVAYELHMAADVAIPSARSLQLATVEDIETQWIRSTRRPQTKRVDVTTTPSHDGRVIGDRFDRFVQRVHPRGVG